MGIRNVLNAFVSYWVVPTTWSCVINKTMWCPGSTRRSQDLTTPVRVFCPLNIGGVLAFGGIRVNILLWFCATFPWTCSHDVGVKGKFLMPQRKAVTTLTKFHLMQWVVDLSWGKELRLESRFEIRLRSLISKAWLAATSTSHNFLIWKLEIVSWGSHWGQVGGLSNTLMTPSQC